MKQKLEIVKKCYQVRVATVSRYFEEDGWEEMMANTPAEAKRNFDRDIDPIDLEARRYKDCDLVLFEGREELRFRAMKYIESQKLKAKRTKLVMRFPADTMFYVHKGYSGNSVAFWAKGGGGYTTNIERAELFTRQEILDDFCGFDYEVKIWPAKEVEARVIRTVDSQYLDQKQLC
jgi:hypothetical protein